MSQFWPSYYSTIGFYRVGNGAANFYQSSAFPSHSWRKIELIDLTKNSGFKCGPLSATYHTSPSPGITTESKRIRSVRNFSFDHQAVCQLHG